MFLEDHWANMLTYGAQRSKKDPHAIHGQRRPLSACANAQANLGHRCPLTVSMDTVVCVDEQIMLRADCTKAYVIRKMH